MRRRGAFVLTEELARGELGTLYEARAEDDPDQKLLVKELNSPPGESWLQSISTLQAIECPTLRVPLQIGSDDEGAFLLLEYLDGPNLEKARVEQYDGRVPVRKALMWLKHLLEALSELHDRNLLHGDVKPSNLVLNSRGDAVLVDLGALQTFDSGEPDLATPEYLIPDKTKQSRPDRDLYAAALTFGALLTGKIPNPEERPQLSKEDPLIPQACDELLLRGLRLDQPYRSARQMLAVVQRLLGEQKPSSTTSPPTRMVKLPQARKKLTLWPLVIALFCYPLGMAAAHLWKSPPAGESMSVFQVTGIDIQEGNVHGQAVWRTTILNRPVAAFAGADPAEGDESAKARAHWLAAVLSEAYFEGRILKFEYRRELEDQCEVWLVGSERPDKFCFRVTKAESDLFETKAPVLARLWTRLMQDTMTLLGASGSPGNSAGVLALRPWKSRAETLAGGRNLSGADKAANLKEAFDSLKPSLKEDILDSYLPKEKEE